MDSQEIKTLIDAMADSGLSEMEFSRDGWTLRLVRAGGRAEASEALPSPAAPAPESDTGIQTAPLAGVLHLTPSPENHLLRPSAPGSPSERRSPSSRR